MTEPQFPAVPASAEAIEWLDENAEDGGFLFVYRASRPFPYYAHRPPDGGDNFAHCISTGDEEWGKGNSPVPSFMLRDEPLTDEELEAFLEAYGFKPVENDQGVLRTLQGVNLPIGNWVFDLSNGLPSTDYIHVDAVRKVGAVAGQAEWEIDNLVDTLRAFEALRRAEL